MRTVYEKLYEKYSFKLDCFRCDYEDFLSQIGEADRIVNKYKDILDEEDLGTINEKKQSCYKEKDEHHKLIKRYEELMDFLKVALGKDDDSNDEKNEDNEEGKSIHCKKEEEHQFGVPLNSSYTYLTR